jgi:hypothetical protein
MPPCPLGIGDFPDAHEDTEGQSAIFTLLSSLPISVLGIRLRSGLLKIDPVFMYAFFAPKES